MLSYAPTQSQNDGMENEPTIAIALRMKKTDASIIRFSFGIGVLQ